MLSRRELIGIIAAGVVSANVCESKEMPTEVPTAICNDYSILQRFLSVQEVDEGSKVLFFKTYNRIDNEMSLGVRGHKVKSASLGTLDTIQEAAISYLLRKSTDVTNDFRNDVSMAYFAFKIARITKRGRANVIIGNTKGLAKIKDRNLK